MPAAIDCRSRSGARRRCARASRRPPIAHPPLQSKSQGSTSPHCWSAGAGLSPGGARVLHRARPRRSCGDVQQGGGQRAVRRGEIPSPRTLGTAQSGVQRKGVSLRLPLPSSRCCRERSAATAIAAAAIAAAAAAAAMRPALRIRRGSRGRRRRRARRASTLRRSESVVSSYSDAPAGCTAHHRVAQPLLEGSGCHRRRRGSGGSGGGGGSGGRGHR